MIISFTDIGIRFARDGQAMGEVRRYPIEDVTMEIDSRTMRVKFSGEVTIPMDSGTLVRPPEFGSVEEADAWLAGLDGPVVEVRTKEPVQPPVPVTPVARPSLFDRIFHGAVPLPPTARARGKVNDE